MSSSSSSFLLSNNNNNDDDTENDASDFEIENNETIKRKRGIG